LGFSTTKRFLPTRLATQIIQKSLLGENIYGNFNFSESRRQFILNILYIIAFLDSTSNFRHV